jgi:hypothetical protein
MRFAHFAEGGWHEVNDSTFVVQIITSTCIRRNKMKITVRLLLITAFGLALVAAILFTLQGALTVSSAGPANRVLARALDIETGRVQKHKYEQLLSSGALYTLLQESGELDRRANSVRGVQPRISTPGTQGCQNTFTNGALLNIRVNQDCSLRRQAEQVIVANPLNSKNLIAGQNDSRVGFNNCGYDWSFDGGMTWGDQVPAFYQFVMADGYTADACSDPTATFDSLGNAYIAGILFDINSAASAFVVAKSNAGIGGAFYHSPLVQTFQAFRDSPLGVVANDNDPNIFHDKEFIVADANPLSPKANRVYATWTRFNAATGAGVGGDSPIYFSQSTNGGATWSAGIEISGVNAAVCTIFSGEANPNACDQNQGSHPIVGPDGTIYVAFANGNTPTLGVNQHLIVKCPAASNCTLPASWTAPVMISDDIGKQPVGPDATSGCPAGRQCLPLNGYRLDDFVEGSLSVDNNSKLYFAWADFRNGGGTCDWNDGAAGQATIATPPCNNDVFYSYSTDGGATWSAAFNVTPTSTFGQSAQWMPWNAVTPSGAKLFIAFYDRSYGTCETTGCNDITLATIQNAATASPSLAYKRLTTASMPNLVVANNPLEAGFLGDYMWVAPNGEGNPLVVWADTRGLNNTVEEDIYFSAGQ